MTKKFRSGEHIAGNIGVFIVWLVTLLILNVHWVKAMWLSWAISATVGIIHILLTEDNPEKE